MGDLAIHHRGVGTCADWLRTERLCNPVLTEVPILGGKERADSLGFPPREPSIVIDWKNDQDDAKAHLEKEHVRCPEAGVGQLRYLASMPYVVEWESLRKWPHWLGLLWWTGSDFTVRREAGHCRLFNIYAEREALRAYAAKAGYQQRGAVQRQTWLDKAHAAIASEGPMRAAAVAKRFQPSESDHKVALAMERDGRFIQVGGAGGAFDVIRKEANHAGATAQAV